MASEDKCPTCGEQATAPNVRAANSSVERGALQERYDEALARAESRGAKDAVLGFRSALENSTAVVSCDLYLLRELTTNSNKLYTNYYLGVQGEVRRAAELQNDRQRTTVDAILFGTYAKQIRNAALSLDGAGLRSYGKDGLSYGLELREIAVAKRASLLEENAYDFVERHHLTANSSIPAGYRCTWDKRPDLGMAKLADLIGPGMPPSEYPRILLGSTGERSTDHFIEIHIFGGFNINAISSVCGTSTPPRPDDRAVITMVKELLEKQGKRWIESS